jgi:hypothetical protein
MNVTFTNRGLLAVPLSCSQDKGFAVLIDPGMPYTVNVPDVTVVNVGDNPSFLEELAESVKDLIDIVLKWREKKVEDGNMVAVEIVNHGPNGLRVLLGSNVNEVTVSPGTAYEATAEEYIEVRELGV